MIISFVVALAVLITVHEFGHFQTARWCGVKVLKFSLGFGKPLYVRKIGKDRTEFMISAIPLGGFVKMLDEREMSENDLIQLSASERLRSFNRQTLWKRSMTVMAGPLANLMLAVVLFAFLFGTQGAVGIRPIVDSVEVGSPAYDANMKKDDVISSIDGHAIHTWQDIHWRILQNIGSQDSIEVVTTNSQGAHQNHKIRLSGLNKNQMETDFITELGLKPYIPKVPAKIGQIVKSGPASLAGLKPHDLIVAVNGIEIKTWEQFVEFVQQRPNEKLVLGVIREAAKLDIILITDSIKEGEKNIGRIGAGVDFDDEAYKNNIVKIEYSPVVSLLLATEKTYEISIFSLKMLGKMLVGEASIKAVSGPISIASYSGKSAEKGFVSWVAFLALLSISLGVLNLLPIPLLDGGHLLYYMVEAVKGSPVSDQVMMIGQKIGFVLLGFLMIIAFYNDLNRLITG